MPRRVFRSLRGRVTAGALIVVAVVLGVGAVATVGLLERTLTDGVRVSLEQDLSSIRERLDGRGGPRLDDIDDDLLVRLSGPRGDVNDEDAAPSPPCRKTAPHGS